VKQGSAISESFAAALHSAREARERTHAALDLLAPKIIDNEYAGHAIVSLVDIFTEICGSYALIHEMMKPCLEISGVDLSHAVTAALARKRSGAQRAPTAVGRAFGHVVRQLRASRSVRSNDLAICAGIEAHRYHEIDSGISEPNLVELTRIAAALGLRSAELVERFESVSLVPRAIDSETAAQ
jgi:hypothetical protein